VKLDTNWVPQSRSLLLVGHGVPDVVSEQPSYSDAMNVRCCWYDMGPFGEQSTIP